MTPTPFPTSPPASILSLTKPLAENEGWMPSILELAYSEPKVKQIESTVFAAHAKAVGDRPITLKITMSVRDLGELQLTDAWREVANHLTVKATLTAKF